MEIYTNFTGSLLRQHHAPALMTHTTFVVFLKTLAPGLTWSHKNLKCNQLSGLCRKAWKSAHSKGTKVSGKRNPPDLGGLCFLTLRYTLSLQHHSSKLRKIAWGSLPSQGRETGEGRAVCFATWHLETVTLPYTEKDSFCNTKKPAAKWTT